MEELVTKKCLVETCTNTQRTKGYCWGHYRRLLRYGNPLFTPQRKVKSVRERFEEMYVPEPMSGCWLWTASTNPDGYGQIEIPRVNGKRKNLRAHRLAYELYRGEIPEGMHLDHLCRTRCCVNPYHLEPVTIAENTRRGVSVEVIKTNAAARTHCRNGHLLTPESTYLFKGTKLCRICRKINSKRHNSMKSKTPKKGEFYNG